MFAPGPVVCHRDREQLLAVLKHHYDWGHHQYFVQLGNDFSRPVFSLWYRALFALMFTLALPFYAAMGCVLNILPWLSHRPRYILWLPAMYLVWLAKSVALLSTALTPQRYLREARQQLGNSYYERSCT